MSDTEPCIVDGCVALASAGASLCAVHVTYARREPGSAPIHCYACGELIRVDARWVVRAEGAFHVRPWCLTASPVQYVTAVVMAASPDAPAVAGEFVNASH